MVNGNGVLMTIEKLTMIANWPDPVTLKEMCNFVRLTGVYHHFIKNFAKITAPLTTLLNVMPTEFNRVQKNTEKWKQVTSAIDILMAAMMLHPALTLLSKK